MVAPVIPLALQAGRVILPKALKYAGKAYNAYYYGSAVKSATEGDFQPLTDVAQFGLLSKGPKLLKSRDTIITDGGILNKKAPAFKPVRYPKASGIEKIKDTNVAFDRQGSSKIGQSTVKKPANEERFKYSTAGRGTGGKSVKTVDKNIGGKKVGSINPRTGKQQYSYEGGKTFTIHYDKEGKLASYIVPSAPGSKLGNIRLSGGMLPKYRTQYDALTNKVTSKPEMATGSQPVKKTTDMYNKEVEQVRKKVASRIEDMKVKGDPITEVAYGAGDKAGKLIATEYKRQSPNVKVMSVMPQMVNKKGKQTWSSRVTGYNQFKNIKDLDKSPAVIKAATNRQLISKAKQDIIKNPGAEQNIILYTSGQKSNKNFLTSTAMSKSDINYINKNNKIGRPVGYQLSEISGFRGVPPVDINLTKTTLKHKVKGGKLTDPKDILLANNKIKGPSKGARDIFKKPPKK
jgi:hypothetical protein